MRVPLVLLELVGDLARQQNLISNLETPEETGQAGRGAEGVRHVEEEAGVCGGVHLVLFPHQAEVVVLVDTAADDFGALDELVVVFLADAGAGTWPTRRRDRWPSPPTRASSSRSGSYVQPIEEEENVKHEFVWTGRRRQCRLNFKGVGVELKYLL